MYTVLAEAAVVCDDQQQHRAQIKVMPLIQMCYYC